MSKLSKNLEIQRAMADVQLAKSSYKGGDAGAKSFLENTAKKFNDVSESPIKIQVSYSSLDVLGVSPKINLVDASGKVIDFDGKSFGEKLDDLKTDIDDVFKSSDKGDLVAINKKASSLCDDFGSKVAEKLGMPALSMELSDNFKKQSFSDLNASELNIPKETDVAKNVSAKLADQGIKVTEPTKNFKEIEKTVDITKSEVSEDVGSRLGAEIPDAKDRSNNLLNTSEGIKQIGERLDPEKAVTPAQKAKLEKLQETSLDRVKNASGEAWDSIRKKLGELDDYAGKKWDDFKNDLSWKDLLKLGPLILGIWLSYEVLSILGKQWSGCIVSMTDQNSKMSNCKIGSLTCKDEDKTYAENMPQCPGSFPEDLKIKPEPTPIPAACSGDLKCAGLCGSKYLIAKSSDGTMNYAYSCTDCGVMCAFRNVLGGITNVVTKLVTEGAGAAGGLFDTIKKYLIYIVIGIVILIVGSKVMSFVFKGRGGGRYEFRGGTKFLRGGIKYKK